MNDATQGQFGYPGQMGLTDGNSDFQVTAFIVQQMMAEFRTMIPVKVIAVTPGGIAAGGGTVTVQPLVSQVDGTLGNPVQHGNIFGIPYFRLQGGDSAVVVDPAIGDIGYMAVADRDISGVKAARGIANPSSRRRGSLSDGIYVGGILNDAPAQYLVFTSQGITIADRNGNKIEMKSGSIAITGNLTVTGSITAGLGGPDLVTLQAHIHASNGAPPTPGH